MDKKEMVILKCKGKIKKRGEFMKKKRKRGKILIESEQFKNCKGKK